MRLYLSALIVVILVAALSVDQAQSSEDAPLKDGLRKKLAVKKIKLKQEVCANRTREKWLDDILTRDCGRRYVTGGRIAGGYNASWGEFPSFVRLSVSYDLNYCGGTLIGPRHVLTAAHCVYPNMSVHTTIFSIDERPELRYEVAKACKSRLFNGNIHPKDDQHDVAILKLARPVQLTRYVQPACMPHKSVCGQRGLKAIGLGKMHYSNETKSFTQFPQLRVLPVSWSECPPDQVSEPRAKFCTFYEDPWYPGKQCFGDSGAPIYSREDGRMVVAGFTSYGADITSCERNSDERTVNFDVFGASCEVIKLLEECK